MITTSNLQASGSNFNSVTGNQFNITLPVTEYVPPKRVNDAPIDLVTANFTGRLKDLDFLFQAFRAQTGSTEEDLPTRCAVHGMPGVGKTKLILQFIKIAFSQLLYSHIFWMSATTTDKLIEGMTKILDLVGHPERIRSDQNAKLAAARLWLEDSQQIESVRWLLVLDNVDRRTLEFMRENLPRRNGTGSIVFTTRTEDVAGALVDVSGGPHCKIDLRVPDLEETTHLLFLSAGIDVDNVTSDQKSQAEELVQAFGSLPLAVVHAASYMKQTAMTLDDMLRLSKSEHKIDVIQWENDLTTYQQKSVVSTFDTLLGQLEEDSPESFDLLTVLSFLDAEDIPLGMLIDGAQASSRLVDKPPPEKSQHRSNMFARMKKWVHVRRPSTHHTTVHTSTPTHPLPEFRDVVSLILSTTAFPDALRKLQKLSLVERWSREGKPSLRMHDLVHFMTRENVKRRSAYRAWLQSSISLICSAWNDIEDPEVPQWWPECEKIMPHLHSLSKACTTVRSVNLMLITANVRLARYLKSRGRYDDAERLCERSVESFEKELGDDHQDTLTAVYTLARIYYDQGRLVDAEEAYKRVLMVRVKELGDDHYNTLATTNNLALVYCKQGRHKEAEGLYKQMLAVEEKKLGLDHPNTLMTTHNLAFVYESQSRYDEARELYEDVLSRRKTHLGPAHIHTLITANNLAVIYRGQTKYNDAEELFKHVLVSREKQLGLNHPDTLVTAVHLGILYRLQERNDEAEEFLLRAIIGQKQQLGANHPHTLWCAKELADLYRSQGRNDEADALLDSAPGQ